MLIALLTFATGCAQHGENTQDASSTDSGDHPAHPIDGLDPSPLSAFREMRRTSMPQAIEPQSLLLEEHHGQALILDQEAATVWATDSLYLHDPRPACINQTEVRASFSLPDGDSACPDGTEKVARGQLHTPLPPAAIAAVPASGHVAVLDSGGQLHWITTDSTQSTSFNFMRPQEGPTLAVEISDASTVHLKITHNEIGVAIDNTLHIFDMAGTPTTQWEHGETIHSIDHHDDAWWTTTTNTTHRDGREAGPGGMTLVKSTNTIWVLTETELVPLNSDGAPFNVSQPTGRAVFWNDRMLYTTADGIIESLP
ncbi:MAG: hypothetical protein VYE02_04040, partial [Verrucomicrobiota bacterium]|nr:hypothetical protein [Verrucomicrobiota bacterium]